MKTNNFQEQLHKTHLMGLVVFLIFNAFSSLSQTNELSSSDLESIVHENRKNQLDDYANVYSKFEIHLQSNTDVTIESIQSKLKSLPGVVEVKVNEERTIVEIMVKKEKDVNPVVDFKRELASINLRILSLSEAFYKI
jgi:hypothetical protein